MLNNLTLKKKIVMGGLFPLIFVALINLLGLVNFNGVIESYQWVNHTHEVIEQGLEIRKTASDMETGERGYLLTGDETFLEPYYYREKEYRQMIEALKPLVTDKAALKELTQAEEALVTWKTRIAEKYIRVRKELGDSGEAAQKISTMVSQGEGKAHFDRFRKHIRIFIEAEQALLEQRIEEAKGVTDITNAIIVFGTLAALVLAGLIAVVMVRIITNPIGAIKEAALKISRGETDVDVKVESRDELAEMADAFKEMVKTLNDTSRIAHRIGQGDLNLTVTKRSDEDVLGNALENMLKNLNGIMLELKESTLVLSSAVSEILATTSQVTSGANQTSSAVAETSASVEEIKQTAKLSSTKAAHTAESTEKAMEIAKDGIRALGENMEGLNQIKEKMDLMASNIIQLSEQGQMIGEIITTVEDIANQSNLLAVNASIEAVKAGEHGKGFSVVAQELKNLADQSKQGTKQVQSILSDIQKATGTLVMVAEQGGKAVENGVLQAQNAKKSMDLLNNSVLGAAKASKQIAVSYEQELSGMDQIATAMASIKEATGQNVSSISQVEESVRNLNNLSQKLKELLERYVIAKTDPANG